MPKYDALPARAGSNPFCSPLYLDSTETPGSVTGSIHAIVNHPFATAGAALNSPPRWCDILMLHLNTKYCRAATDGQASFEDQGRSRIMLKNRGLLKFYADPASGRFLGAEMLVPAAEHLAHLLAWALQNRMTVTQMLEMPFYHPVI